MILLRLLDHDLHMSRDASKTIPLWIETPANEGFLPAVVSLTTPGNFGIARHLFGGRIRSGVFAYDSDRLDEVIPIMLRSALGLSRSEGYPNLFKDPRGAFAYIQKQTGVTSQPHAVIVPDSWSDERVEKWGGKDLVKKSSTDVVGSVDIHASPYTFGKTCRVVRYAADCPVFFSRPDFVGMYTQFVGGKTSIVLHNVKSGLSFCPTD